MRALALALVAVLAAVPAWAQEDGTRAVAPGIALEGSLPIEITADTALEWRREEQAYVARGNAKVKRGNLGLAADTLVAYYRARATGGTEIHMFVADGNVVVESPNATAYGNHGTYDIDKRVAVLTGDDLRLETPTDRITANESLEYWQDEQFAIARGDAVATQADNELRAEVMRAEFAEDTSGELAIQRVQATGGVTIVTASDVIRGQEGTYDLTTDQATLTGNVRLTRGENQLNGNRAEVNMATGVSRLFGGGASGPVRGLFIPGEEAGLPGASE